MLKSSLLCLAASLVLSTAVFAEDAPKEKIKPGSTGYLDSLDGFRGVKFGTEFGKFSGLTLDQERGKIKLYVKKGEDLKLGLADLGTIVYHFYDGKFYAVSLHATNLEDRKTLLAIISSAFGDGDQLDPHNVLWQGETAWAQFSENPQSGEGTLIIGDAEISRDLNEYQQQQAADAAAQL